MATSINIMDRLNALAGGSADKGRRLQVARQILGLTEHEAAKRAGVTERTWHKWERGGIKFESWATTDKIYDLGISRDWILSGCGAGLRPAFTTAHSPDRSLVVLPTRPGIPMWTVHPILSMLPKDPDDAKEVLASISTIINHTFGQEPAPVVRLRPKRHRGKEAASQC